MKKQLKTVENGVVCEVGGMFENERTERDHESSRTGHVTKKVLISKSGPDKESVPFELAL